MTETRAPQRSGAGSVVLRTPRPPTLEMVAAAAGVSRATVSRVVNGSPRVRPDVADSVRAAIAELHYVPNRAARSLVSRQTYAIALVVPEDTPRFFGDPYFASIVTGITSRLDASEYVLNLLVSSIDADGKARRYLQGGNVDGALVVSHHSGDLGLVELDAAMPVVFGGRPSVPGLVDTYYVDADNTAGAAAATRYLVERGHRRIAHLQGPWDMSAAVDRRAGFEQVMAGAGLPADAQVSGDFTVLGGEGAMREVLCHWPDVDAVFAASDLMARGALLVLAEHGRRVPDDVALIGYDDSSAAVAGTPKLTTVNQPSVTVGAAMADLLLDLLAGRTPATRFRTLPTHLVLRDTA